MSKKTFNWVAYCWKGNPQRGLVAPDEETLQELIDDYFGGIEKDMRDNCDDWELRFVEIIVGDKQP